MKILILTEFFPTGKDLKFTGGVEARNYYVSKILSKKHQVTIVTSRLKNTKKYEQTGKLRVIRVGETIDYKATTGSIFQRISFVVSCLKESKGLNVDLVEGTNFLTHTIAYLISRNKNIPSVAWYPDVWIDYWIKNAGFIGIVGEVLERINLKLNFSRYIAISNETRKKLLEHVSAKIDVVPCAIDQNEFKRTAKKIKGRIICISRLAKYKNVQDLILAFALLAKNNNQLTLEIVGRGPEEKSLKDLAQALKINKRITFVSNLKRKELVNHLKTAQIFCLPSGVEGFGISIIESAAAVTPYVATNLPVIRETTQKFLGGLSTNLNDAYDLSEKINHLLKDKRIYSQKQKECISLSKMYSWEKVAQQTENIYISLI